MTGKDKRHYSLFPKTLEQCIEPLTRPALKAQGLASSRILTEWESIVGVQMARHTLPEKLSFPPGKKTGGTLVVSTENGFATELQHMQPVILERLATYFGYQAISRIVIAHTWPQAPAPAAKKPASKPVAIKRAVTENVDDPELKAALDALADTLSGKG